MFSGAGAASKHYGSEALAYVQVERSFLIKSHTLPPPSHLLPPSAPSPTPFPPSAKTNPAVWPAVPLIN